jgi:hypothetical protein
LPQARAPADQLLNVHLSSASLQRTSMPSAAGESIPNTQTAD